MRKGYYSEYKAKKELEKTYGRGSIVKIAISQQLGADYLIVSCGELVKVVEVKETHRINYYPSNKEKIQMKRIINFAKQHKIHAELWIYKYKGKGKPVVKQIEILK